MACSDSVTPQQTLELDDGVLGRLDLPRPIRIDSQSRIKANRFRVLKRAQYATRNGCVRSNRHPTRAPLAEVTANPYINAYVVIGILNSDTGSVKEYLRELRLHTGQPEDALKALRKTVKTLRPWYYRFFSLKTVGGFSLYECHPQLGYHTQVEASASTNLSLSELYHDYNAGYHDVDEMWKKWIHRNFNRGDSFPGDKRLALRIVLVWSAHKILMFILVPILLSLGIGFWYMFKAREAGMEMATAVQTAWTISSYIVTTAGVITAVLAAVTSLKDR